MLFYSFSIFLCEVSDFHFYCCLSFSSLYQLLFILFFLQRYAAAAAAAKSLQSCPTLCDPIDSSPPGSPVPGILQARTLEWVQFSSVAQSCPTLCNPMNHSTPGLPVHHKLLEFTQTQVHRVSDAIQPSHPLSSPSPHTPNPSQHQGLFQ